jgi:hypothetical protein
MVEADFIHNQGIVGGEIDAKVEAVCKLEHAGQSLLRLRGYSPNSKMGRRMHDCVNEVN